MSVKNNCEWDNPENEWLPLLESIPDEKSAHDFEMIETRQRIEALLKNLDPRSKLILEYRFVDCMSNREISKMINLSFEDVRKIEKNALRNALNVSHVSGV